MQIRGKIVKVLDTQTGTSKNGSSWTKRGYVLETEGKYPKNIAFDVFKDDVAIVDVDMIVEISIDINSREFNGKWYTNVGAFKIDIISAPKTSAKKEPAAKKAESAALDLPAFSGDDDLPW